MLKTPGLAGKTQAYSCVVYLVWLEKLPWQILTLQGVLEDWVWKLLLV